jgi:phosphoribosylformylglycinamidine synthase
VWTEGIPDIVLFPVAHAEGKFVTKDDATLQFLKENGQVIFRYCSENGQPVAYPGNPNGSVDNIAGITDRTGHVLGLMPHPERHFVFTQHPAWTRFGKKSGYGDGARIFQNGVTYVKENLV